MPSIGVVLGAGGLVGAAYHAGVLTALAESGFDARDAEIIVGTSAGATLAATLRAGFPPLDLARRNLDQRLSPEALAIVARTGGPPSLDLRPRRRSGPPRPASPGLLVRAARHPVKALTGLLPTGTVPTDEIGTRIDALFDGQSWPGRTTWICAVDLGNGDRVVFGRDDIAAPIGVAVRASSSIPGFFEPVTHQGRRYVDGGVHSPTNADLLAGLDVDIVVIVSPMSATSAGQSASLPSARPLHARRLAGEVAALRAAGTAVLTFQPTPADVSVMGRNSMDHRRRTATTASALNSTRQRLADPDTAERLSVLRHASS
ncbi:MAG: patatin-like phospholipase family protein [Ilumatobacter sp.]|nr:patatin-like phospholipase family protein [Ilumatobacter sp.]